MKRDGLTLDAFVHRTDPVTDMNAFPGKVRMSLKSKFNNGEIVALKKARPRLPEVAERTGQVIPVQHS
ncbi:hypothetical protein [Rhizobium herbae]